VSKLRRGELCEGLKVVDFGTGLAGALVAKMFVEAGAAVTRILPGPDPFAAIYPAYEVWQRGKTVLNVDGPVDAAMDTALASADVCILGGEDHPDASPRPKGKLLAARYPRLVVLEISAEPGNTERPAIEALAQARSFAYEHSAARPIMFAFPLASYGAAMQGTIAALAALCERQESGLGQLVSTSLLEGGMMWCAPLWFEAEHPDAALMADIPRDVQPLIFRCADDRYIHFMMGTPGALAKLYRILGIDDPTVDPNDRGMPTGRGERKKFWGDIERIQKHIVHFSSGDILQALWTEGMGAEMVEPPGACWNDPQVAHNGILARSESGTRYVGFPIAKSISPPKPVPIAPPRTAKRGPLAGLKVLDLGSFVAGPYLSVVLGDLGADVIKIEATGGDVNRVLLRAFACTNRGKKSLVMDSKSPAGAEIRRRACLWADVVHHNSRPGVSTKLGIDAATLQKAKPELVVEETSGYGLDGPKAQRAGFDMLFQAFCGHEFRGSGEGDVPLWNRSAIVDFGAGMLGAIAALFALLKRRQGEQPPAMFVNLLDTGLYLMSELVQTHNGLLAGAPRMNAALTGQHPAERLYQAADGWLVLAVRGDAMAARLAQAFEISLPKHVADWGEAEGQIIAATIAARSRQELSALLKKADVWHEMCDADRRDHAMTDPVLQKAGIVLKTADPKYGDFRQIGPAFRFSRTPLVLEARGEIPGCGQHSNEVLQELGYSQAEIENLVAQKVVG